MDFLTTDMVRRYCSIESYNPDPYRQAEIDNKIVTAANKAEQKVYAILAKTIPTSSMNMGRCRC